MEQRQATWGEITDALDVAVVGRVERTRAYPTGTEVSMPLGVLRIVDYPEQGVEVWGCALGRTFESPGFILRRMSCLPHERWRAVQDMLEAKNASAALLPNTLCPDDVETLMQHLVEVRMCCEKMARGAQRVQQSYENYLHDARGGDFTHTLYALTREEKA